MREAHITVVVGRQGVGKTFRQVQECKVYSLDNPKKGRKGRRVLIFDCNVRSGSYKEFKTIDYDVKKENDSDRCSVIKQWDSKYRPEVRRVINFRKDGEEMSMDEMNQTCLDLMKNFRDGMLVLEDTNAYLYGSKQKRFISDFVRVRHKNVDLVLILQTLSALDPRMWGNVSLVRLHKTMDSVDRIRNKIPEKYELIKICQLIVDNEYNKGNIRFFVYVNTRDGKIYGVSKDAFGKACRQYLMLNTGELKRYMLVNEIDKELAINKFIEEKAKYYLVP